MPPESELKPYSDQPPKLHNTGSKTPDPTLMTHHHQQNTPPVAKAIVQHPAKHQQSTNKHPKPIKSNL
jgi:hypothetical protein